MTNLRSARGAVLIALALFFATLARGEGPETDFGNSPDAFPIGVLEPTSAALPTLRDRLVNEGILDDGAFTKLSPGRSAKVRSQNVEELPAPPRDLKPVVKPAASDRQPPHIPTVAEKIQHRYGDPRVVRLLERLTHQSAVSLYVEIGQMIDARHIKPTTYAQRVDGAFDHLLLAIQSTPFRNAAHLQADDQSLDQLQLALTQLKDRAVVRSLNDAVTTMNKTQELVDRHVQIAPGAVGLEFVNAQLDTLDQFSSLIPPEKAGGPSVGLKDNVVGIGVEVEAHGDGLKVLKVLPGGPAAEVQMRRGDILTGVDRQSLKGLELNQAVDYILGQPGTPIKLNLTRAGRRGEVTLMRRRIAVHAVASKMADETSKVGYIKLDTFSESSVKEIDDALMGLHQQGMKSLILDLRGNPGGLLTAAIAISDRFLPEGTIVSTKGRTSADNSLEKANYSQTWKVPMVVLVDRNSASASEILAAAIQENGRGIILGERSYGKGTVQTLFPLQTAPAGLRLTTAKFYSPDGREMAGAGVTPDMEVDPTIGDDAENDAAIAAALKLTADPRLKDMALRFIRTGDTQHVSRLTI